MQRSVTIYVSNISDPFGVRFTSGKIAFQKIRRDSVVMVGIGSDLVNPFSGRVDIVFLHQAVETVAGARETIGFEHMKQAVKAGSGILFVQFNEFDQKPVFV